MTARVGLGFGAGNAKGTIETSAEYLRLGDLNSLGLVVEGGLYVWRNVPALKEPVTAGEERSRRIYGRPTGGGIAIRTRFGAGGWGGSPDPFTLHGSIGVALAGSSSRAGPASAGAYLSVYRTWVNDEEFWTLGLGIGGTLPLHVIEEWLE